MGTILNLGVLTLVTLIIGDLSGFGIFGTSASSNFGPFQPSKMGHTIGPERWTMSMDRNSTTSNNLTFTSNSSGISKVLDSTKSSISNAFSSAKTSISKVMNSTKNSISNTFNSTKVSISKVLNSTKDSISKSFNSTKNSIANVINFGKGSSSSANSIEIRSTEVSISSTAASNFEKGLDSTVSIDVESTTKYYLLGEADRKLCRKLVMVIAKRLMKILNGCIQEVKAKHPEKGGLDKYFQCAVKCGMRRVKMVDDNFKFSNATFNHFIMDFIPETYHVIVYQMIPSCIDQYASIIIAKEIDDPLCVTYGDFIKCLQNVVADVKKYTIEGYG